MNVSVSKNGADLTLFVEGSINTQTAEEFRKAIEGNLDGVSHLVLDLAKVDYVSSAGLRVFLWAQNTFDEKKGSMVVKNVLPAVKEVFDMTGFNDLLTIQ